MKISLNLNSCMELAPFYKRKIINLHFLILVYNYKYILFQLSGLTSDVESRK